MYVCKLHTHFIQSNVIHLAYVSSVVGSVLKSQYVHVSRDMPM